MYTTVRSVPEAASKKRSSRGAFNRTVIALGFTSFFTDISSEMVAAVVPLFLTVQLGFSTAAFGLYQAAYELANASLRVVGGAVADRTKKPKQTAAAGYGISTMTRAGLVGSALAGLPAVPFLLVDRLGKGLRTGPRDAMISLSTPTGSWGTAFGVHRTMDATGALLGPLLATAVLWLLPGSYDSVFVVSFGFGVLGFAVIALRVRNPVVQRTSRTASLRSLFSSHLSNPGFKRIVAVGSAFGIFTVGDSLIYLVIWETSKERDGIGVSGFGIEWFPLLFVGTALAYLVTATPLGRLADAWGRARMWVAGHVVLAGVYVALLADPTSSLGIMGVLALLGVFYGATDGMLPALASGVIDEEVRSSGLAVLTTSVAVSRAVSAASFGLIWQWLGADRALMISAAGLLTVIAVASTNALLRAQRAD